MIHCLKPDLLPAKFNSVKLKELHGTVYLFRLFVHLSLQHTSIFLDTSSMTFQGRCARAHVSALRQLLLDLRAEKGSWLHSKCNQVVPYPLSVHKICIHTLVRLHIMKLSISLPFNIIVMLDDFCLVMYGSQWRANAKHHLMPQNGQAVADQNQWQKLEPSRRL